MKRGRAPFYVICAVAILAPLGGCGPPASDTPARDSEGSTGPVRRTDGRDTRALTERFRRTLNRMQEREGFPGAVAAFSLPSGRIGVVSAGQSDVEAGTSMPPHARLQSGSIGKTFVAAVGLSLALEGRLDLDAPAGRYVGDRDWFGRLPNHEAITVRHLMTHSSGLADHVYDEGFAADVARRVQEDPGATMSPEELIAYIEGDPPLFAPGKGYAYTDTGYLVLGRVLEAAGGAPYYEMLRERFLDPLGLDFTVPSAPLVEYQAAGYMAPDNPFGLPAKTLEGGVMVFNPEIEWTGGGLSTNPADLVKWAKVLYEGEAMEGPYVEELLGSKVAREPGSEEGYGLGVYIGDSPFGPTFGHGGWFPGYRSDLRYFPDHRIAVAFQTNTDVGVDLGAYMMELTQVVLDGMPKENREEVGVP